MDFNPGSGTDMQSGGSFYNGFITKTNADGSYGYTYTYAGNGTDSGGNAVAVDSNDNVYIGGNFEGSIDFDPTAGTDIHTSISSNCGDSFITKINANGSYGYTKTFGTTTPPQWCNTVSRLAIDSSNNIYAAGTFSGTVNFNSSGSDVRVSPNLYEAAYVTKINADGSYGRTDTFTGTDNQFVWGLAIDKNNKLAAGINFKGTIDLNPGAGTDNHTSAGDKDAAVVEIDSSGAYQTGLVIGGAGADEVDNVRFDSQNNLWLAGDFTGSVDFDPTAGTDTQSAAGGGAGSFYTEINSNGSYGKTIVYSSTAGDVLPDDALFDSSGKIYLLGTYVGTIDFDPSAGVDSHTSQAGGYGDTYLAVLNSDGTYSGSQFLTGNNSVTAYAGAIDVSDNVYLTGVYDSTTSDFDPTAGVDNHAALGFYDMFLTKLNGPAPAAPDSGGSSPSPVVTQSTKLITSKPADTAAQTAASPDNGTVLNSSPGFSTDTGAAVSLASGDAVKFSLPAANPGETHTATVQSVGSDFIVLSIASQPINLRLSVGDTRLVDVDRNGSDDLSVNLKSLVGNKATLVFKLLKEPSVVKTAAVADTTTLKGAAKPSSTKLLYGAIGLALLIAGGITTFYMNKRRKFVI